MATTGLIRLKRKWRNTKKKKVKEYYRVCWKSPASKEECESPFVYELEEAKQRVSMWNRKQPLGKVSHYIKKVDREEIVEKEIYKPIDKSWLACNGDLGMRFLEIEKQKQQVYGIRVKGDDEY